MSSYVDRTRIDPLTSLANGCSDDVTRRRFTLFFFVFSFRCMMERPGVRSYCWTRKQSVEEGSEAFEPQLRFSRILNFVFLAAPQLRFS